MDTETLIAVAKEICPTTTQQKVREGALLVDVRERDEVEHLAYDVPNIINIPLSEFEERYAELPKDRPLVMVCKGGGRSLKATYYLMNHGYTDVVNMQHGIIRWAKKGFPTKGDIFSVLEPSANSSCCGTSADAQQSCCDAPTSSGAACC
jgi:rhodanese-related sulfurtransferase